MADESAEGGNVERSPWKVRAHGTGLAMVADPAEVRRALALFVDPEHACEVRALTTGAHRTVDGADLDGLAAAVADLPSGIGIYFILNPVPCGLAEPAKNGDIVCRRWVYFDIDPVKPKGEKGRSATDAEKEGARSVGQKVHDYLAERGWPSPVIVDSGNGVALYYRTDLPNDDASRSAYRRLLDVLAKTFDGTDGTIDKSVHSAAQLVKLPGTWARKGPDSDDRPHRACRIVFVPRDIERVSLEDLQRAAGGEPGPTPSVNGTAKPPAEEARRALDSGCARIVMAARTDEGRNNVLNAVAFDLGKKYVGPGVIEAEEVANRLYEAACESGLDVDDNCGPEGIRKTIKSGLSSGANIPPDPVPVLGRSSPWSIPVEGRPHGPVTYTVPELLALDLPAPRWAIPGLLSEGLTILAGKPKLGKSWLALNLAMTVAAGGMALGSIRVQSGDVLYLALEDRLRRIRDRAAKVLGGLKITPPGRLSIAVEWNRQDRGGVADLAGWLGKASDPRLVVIDVWAKFRAPAKNKGSAYDQDYEQLTEVKSMADRYGASVVAVHHTRKSAAEDVFDEISGTLGLAGAADGSMVLARSRGANEGTLAMTGRDIEEQTIAVEFDPQTFTWKSHGSAEERMTGELQKRVLDYLKKLNGRATYAKDIAEALNEDVNKIRPTLHRLFEKLLIRHVGNAWSYPGDVEESQ